MNGDEKKKVIELSQLKNLIYGKDEFDIVINNDGKTIKIRMRSLTGDDMAKINNIIAQRDIQVGDILKYSEELRILKIVYSLVGIEVDDNSVIKTDDKIALEEAIRALPDTVIKALTFKYDEYTTKIYEKLEKKN